MQQHVDTETLKRDYPITDVIARYGIQLRPSGRTLVGRCPFHADGGRPNLHIYPDSGSFYCYRCALGGDVISFVQRIEGVGFSRAVQRLADQPGRTIAAGPRSPQQRTKTRRMAAVRDAAELACLAAAVELYQNQLHGTSSARAYLARRGLRQTTLEQCRVGYARGDELVAYLRWRRLPLTAAIRAGLIGSDGHERFAGRVVVPEIRRGQPIWLIGRSIDAKGEEPKYLSLPGRKPLLGWETASPHSRVFLVEGVFDWLTLRCWGFPGVALIGTNARASILRAMTRFARIYLVLDADQAGRQATTLLAQTLGTRTIPVFLSGVKDIAELAEHSDGRQVFTAAVNAVIREATLESQVPDADVSAGNADHGFTIPAPAGEWPVLPPCQQIKEVSDGL